MENLPDYLAAISEAKAARDKAIAEAEAVRDKAIADAKFVYDKAIAGSKTIWNIVKVMLFGIPFEPFPNFAAEVVYSSTAGEAIAVCEKAIADADAVYDKADAEPKAVYDQAVADSKVVRENARAQARAVYKKTMTETVGDKAIAEAKAIYEKAKDEAEAVTVRSNARAVYKKTMTEAVRSNDLNPNSLQSIINFEAAKDEAEKVRDNAIKVNAQTVYDNGMAESKAAWSRQPCYHCKVLGRFEPCRLGKAHGGLQ